LSPATFTAPPVDEEESPRTYTITAKATGYNDAPGEIEVRDKPLETCEVKGEVKDKSTGLVISGATVSYSSIGGGSDSDSTNGDGEYSFTDIQSGYYYIFKASASDDYEPVTFPPEKIDKETTEIDFELEPRVTKVEVSGQALKSCYDDGEWKYIVGGTVTASKKEDGVLVTVASDTTSLFGKVTLKIDQVQESTQFFVTASKSGEYNSATKTITIHPDGTITPAANLIFELEPLCGCGDEDPDNTCFLAGTQIVMANGNTQSIETIKEGDEVKSVDTNTGEIVDGKVTEMFIHPPEEMIGNYYLSIKIGLEANGLEVTKEHPFYIDGRGWIEAGDLKVGNNFGGEIIRSIEKIYVELENRPTTYNFEVDGTHTYMVAYGNIEGLVHNQNAEYESTTETVGKIIITGDKINTNAIVKEAAPVVIDKTINVVENTNNVATTPNIIVVENTNTRLT